jgi:hypothetical protein
MSDKIKTPFGTAESDITPMTSVNVGTVGTGVTAQEYGDATHHLTVLTIAATSPAVVGTLGVGNLIYTFPAGAIIIHGGDLKVGVDGVTGNHANANEIGVGTVICSGAVSVNSGTATFENIITSAVAACAGVVVPSTSAAQLAIATSDAHTAYLNVAATYTGADPGMALAGTVVLEWTYLGA